MTIFEISGLLGNFGEFFGAIAVFATLAYLAVQIRLSTQVERSTAYDARIKNFMSVRQLTIETSEMAEIFYKGNNDPLSLNEEHRTPERQGGKKQDGAVSDAPASVGELERGFESRLVMLKAFGPEAAIHHAGCEPCDKYHHTNGVVRI